MLDKAGEDLLCNLKASTLFK